MPPRRKFCEVPVPAERIPGGGAAKGSDRYGRHGRQQCRHRRAALYHDPHQRCQDVCGREVGEQGSEKKQFDDAIW